MKLLFRLTACLIVALNCSQLDAQQKLQVLAGHQRRLSVFSGSKVNIGDPTICTAYPINNREIILTGQNKGITSLTIVGPDGNMQEKFIEVISMDPKIVIQEIESILGQMTNVTFRSIAGDKVVAEGNIRSSKEMDKFRMIIDLYPNIVNWVEDFSEKETLSIEINILEISHTKNTDFGNDILSRASIQTPDAGNLFSQKPKLTWSIASTDQLLDQVLYWVTNGSARVVANPHLSVVSGDSAKFISGGEVPFQYSTRDGLAVEWKAYGLIVKVAPIILPCSKVELHMEAEISDIDQTLNAQMGVPAIRKRKAQSISVLRIGETAILAGLYQLNKSKETRRVPVLGHIFPWFFSSQKSIEEIKEIVILVTPYLPSKISQNDYPLIKEDKNK